MPASHGVHALDPLAAYVPTGHTAHTAFDVAASAIENRPAGQSSQFPAPVRPENRPFGHGSHIPLVEKRPIEQRLVQNNSELSAPRT